MKPVSHQYEDKLLEFAYGELPAHEASAVESHVKSCARCTSALDQIRTVRNAMSALPAQVPSDNGLDSLMAYAEQAARRNAQAAAPAPFFSKWMKWVAPLAGVTAVLLVGGVYMQASKNVDLSPSTAAQESVKKADDNRKGWESSPAPNAQALAPDAPKPVVNTLDEAGEKPADAVAQTAPEEKDVADLEVAAKGAPMRKTGKITKAPAKKELSRQRDDKEANLDGLLANEPPKVEAAAHGAAVNQGGKGGGGRTADTGNYYDAKTNGYPKAGLSTGPSSNNAQLGSELSKADTAAPRGSLEKRAAPKENAKSKQEEASNDRDNSKQAQNDSEPYRAKKSKKTSTAEPANNVGGGEIVNPTGSYSSSVANKPAETKPEAKKPAPAPVADKKTESELTVAANEGSRGATQWGLNGATKDEKKQGYDQPAGEQQQVRREAAPQQQVAQAQQPPPPATQSSSPGSSSMRLAPGLQRGQQRSGEDESMLGGDAQGPPSSVNTKQMASRQAARQSQLADLMKQARAANDAGDFNTELKLSLELLQSDAEGDLRAEGLYRMCKGLQRIGKEDQAQQYCDALVNQFPQTRWAAMSRSDQKNQRSTPAKAAERRKVESYDDAEKPAPAPPPQKSAPADAMHAY